VTVETYSFERKAEALLSTASAAKDYARARQNAKNPGWIPGAIPQKGPK